MSIITPTTAWIDIILVNFVKSRKLNIILNTMKVYLLIP